MIYVSINGLWSLLTQFCCYLGRQASKGGRQMGEEEEEAAASRIGAGGSRGGGPRSAEEYCQLGGQLRRQGRLEEALGAYDKAVAADPGSFKALFSRGYLRAKVLPGFLGSRAAWGCRDTTTASPDVCCSQYLHTLLAPSTRPCTDRAAQGRRAREQRLLIRTMLMVRLSAFPTLSTPRFHLCPALCRWGSTGPP